MERRNALTHPSLFHTAVAIALAALLAIALATPATAQYINDDCASAIEVQVAPEGQAPVWTLAQMSYAQSSIDPTACSGTGQQDVWFKFTATASAHRIKVDRSRGWWVQVFSGSCGSLSSIHCEQLSSPPAVPVTQMNHIVVNGLTVGNTYWFRLYRTTALADELNRCHVSLALPLPNNDDCTSAQPLPIMPWADSEFAWQQLTEASTTQATAGPAGCSNATATDDDVWFSFTATAPKHSVVAKWMGIGAVQMALEVHGGTCASPTVLQCLYSFHNDNAVALTGLTPGSSYRIRVYTPGTTNRIDFWIGVLEMASNDECAGALPITISMADEMPAPINVPGFRSSPSAMPGGCTAMARDLWYRFTAPDEDLIFNRVYTPVGGSNTYFSLLQGGCGALTCLYSNVPNRLWATGLVPGQTYWLAVRADIEPGNHQFTARSLHLANDECTDALPLTPQPGETADNAHAWIWADTWGATDSGLPACAGSDSDDDLWYRFTATSRSHLLHVQERFMDNNLPRRHTVELFSGTCGSLTSIFCAGSDSGTGTAVHGLSGLTVGATYRLRLHTRSSGANERSIYRIALATAAGVGACEDAVVLAPATLEQFPQLAPVFPLPGGSTTPAPCAGDASLLDMSRWFRFTTPGTTAAFVAAGSFSNLRTELFSGACDALASMECQNFTQTGSCIRYQMTGLVPGSTYHLRVWGMSGGIEPGTFITPMLFGPPANDDIGGATPLPANASPYSHPASTAWTYGATRSGPQICTNPSISPDDDVWFYHVATGTSATFKVVRENIYFSEVYPFGTPQPKIEVFHGLHTDSASLAANFAGCSGFTGNEFSTHTVNGLTPGDTLYMRVYSASTDRYMAISPHVVGGDNNEAAGALPVAYTNHPSVRFNTAGATQSLPGGACPRPGTADDDIWFRFTAQPGEGRIVVQNATEDLTLELFGGAPGNLTSLACSGNILVLPGDLVPGQTYWFRLYSLPGGTPVSGLLGLWSDPSLTANPLVDEACLGPVLLENPGLEQGALCMPSAEVNVVGPYQSQLAPGWWTLDRASADSYNSCAPYNSHEEAPSHGAWSEAQGRLLAPRRGQGMIGYYTLIGGNTTYKEPVQARLTEPMIPGEAYLISYHAAITQPLKFAGLGAYLSTGPLTSAGAPTTAQVPHVVSGVIDGPGWENTAAVVVPTEAYDHITISMPYYQSNMPAINLSGIMQGFFYAFLDDIVVARIIDPQCITGLGDVAPPWYADDAASGGDALRVYPNPANDQLSIVVDAAAFGQRAVIDVFDATGKQVHSEQAATALGAVYQLDLSRITHDGLYMVMLRVEGQAPRAARVVVKR